MPPLKPAACNTDRSGMVSTRRSISYSYSRLYFALGFGLFLCWCLLLLGPLDLPHRGFDFRIFYTAASLPLGSLYDLDTVAEYQRDLWKEHGTFVTSPFPRPPFYAVLLKPLAWMDYSTALHVWLGLIIAALMCAIVMMHKLYGTGPEFSLILLTYYPFSQVVRNGQDTPFILLTTLAAIYCLRRNKPWWAALYFAFAFDKFNLAYLLPVVLLLQGKKSLLLKLAAVLGGLALLSAAVIGPAGVAGYWQTLTGGSLDDRFWDGWNLRATIWQFGWNPVVYGGAVAAVGGWFLWLASRLEFETAVWFSFLASLLLTWHCFNHDYTVALPFFYLAWSRYRVYLAGVCLAGVLWAHFWAETLGYEGMAPFMTILLLLVTVELGWKSGRAGENARLGQSTATEPQQMPAT